MNEQEKKEIVYLAMKDIYKEFNRTVNHMVILREFLDDVCKFSEGKKEKPKFYYPSVEKARENK